MDVSRVEEAFLGQAEPEVPIQAIGYRRRLSGYVDALRPNRPPRPIVHLADLPGGVRLEPFLDGGAVGFVRRAEHVSGKTGFSAFSARIREK